MLNKANLVKVSQVVFNAIKTQESTLCTLKNGDVIIPLEIYPNGDKVEVMINNKIIDSYWIDRSQGDVLMTSLVDIILDAEEAFKK